MIENPSIFSDPRLGDLYQAYHYCQESTTGQIYTYLDLFKAFFAPGLPIAYMYRRARRVGIVTSSGHDGAINQACAVVENWRTGALERATITRILKIDDGYSMTPYLHFYIKGQFYDRANPLGVASMFREIRQGWLAGDISVIAKIDPPTAWGPRGY